MTIHFESWTDQLEGPYSLILEEMPEQEKTRLAHLSLEDRQKALAIFLDKKIQEKALALLDEKSLDILQDQKYRQAISRHAYYYLVSLNTGRARLLFPQYDELKVEPDEVALSLAMRQDVSLDHMKEAMLESFVLKLDHLKVEILSMEVKQDRAVVSCFHKDWGQTKLSMVLDPRIVENIQVISEYGLLREKMIGHALSDVVLMDEAYRSSQKILEENAENTETEEGLDPEVLKQNIAKAGIAVMVPMMNFPVSKASNSQEMETLQNHFHDAKQHLEMPQAALLQKKSSTQKSSTLSEKQRPLAVLCLHEETWHL